jgi:hypothetical protein
MLRRVLRMLHRMLLSYDHRRMEVDWGISLLRGAILESMPNLTSGVAAFRDDEGTRTVSRCFRLREVPLRERQSSE